MLKSGGAAGAAAAAPGGNRRGSISLNNPDKIRQAKIDAAKAKRQRAMEYGNSALKATTREGQLKDLKKQASHTFFSPSCRFVALESSSTLRLRWWFPLTHGVCPLRA